ncbi:hypothetical protein UB31_00445 [Bradyrhizobium sp. LTSP849]|uniref:hypothetical protein n=1 Tax=Bradyrhizobium sp. LTSP849 TaxID=1615890 RepID=UPI0005D1D10C|nr:hypothetical protein [Bradyrhizobium sp. LTSP849]KJC55483.1 hypothetical protein UB31_00445 [Bradyrhizobium sp. LTSP849]
MRLLKKLAEACVMVWSLAGKDGKNIQQAEIDIRLTMIRPSGSWMNRVFAAALYLLSLPLWIAAGNLWGNILSRSPRMPKGLIIDLLVPPERADDMLANLQRAYDERWLPKYGARKARRIFLLQATGAVAGFWIDWVRQRLDLIKLFAR